MPLVQFEDIALRPALRKVLFALLDGRSIPQIAQDLELSERCVIAYCSKLVQTISPAMGENLTQYHLWAAEFMRQQDAILASQIDVAHAVDQRRRDVDAMIEVRICFVQASKPTAKAVAA